jgi:acyl-ACP thioesterase
VPFSFVDLNGHMNNTRYFDLAEDMIGESAKGRQLKEISTEYSSEIKIGESMELKWGNEDDLYYLEGNTERRVFRMSLKY